MPACFSMLLSVPIGISRTGCGTVDPSRLHRMLALFVAANIRNLIPAVLHQALYHFPAGHKIRYTLFTHSSGRGPQSLSEWASSIQKQRLQSRIHEVITPSTKLVTLFDWWHIGRGVHKNSSSPPWAA